MKAALWKIRLRRVAPMIVVSIVVTPAAMLLIRAENLLADPVSQTQPSASAQQAPRTLVEIPPPDLSGADAPVVEQVHTAQAALADILAKPNSSASQKAEAFGSLGQTYQAYGFDDAALASYQNAAALAPESFRWHYYLGYLQQRKGDTDSALASYQRAQTAEPANIFVLLRLGLLELTANHLDSAKAWFQESTVPKSPGKSPIVQSATQSTPSASALVGLGKVALAEHEYARALECFKDALAREPQASSIHYQLAMAYRGLGQSEQMQQELQLRGEVDPTIDDPLLAEIDALKLGKVGLLERATKAMHEGRFSDAAAAYRGLIRLNPSDAIAFRYLGVALAQSGQPGEALDAYEHSLALDPKNATAHYSAGILLIETGKPDAAIAHFQNAIRLDPGLIAPHFQLANLLMRAGKDEDAGREYGTVASLEPRNAFARLMQAMAAIHAGDYARGRLLLEQASAAFPDDPDIANSLARLLAAAPDSAVRDPARALHIIEPLVQNQRGDGLEEGITLAMALASAGRFEQAVFYQRAIIEQLEHDGRLDVARPLRQNLDLYEHQKPCRIPWSKDDPIFFPVSGKIQLSQTD